MSRPKKVLRVAVLAGEPSGDALGGRLLAELRAMTDSRIEVIGVGGPLMEAQGLSSLAPLAEFSLMGPFVILRRLPRLVRLVRGIVDEIVDWRPDVLVLIDSPEFTHAVAKRVRKRLDTPVINYVSPTVWAWRPGRARAMRAYVDTVLAVFPFEPDVHAELGGPRCIYIGHPAVELLDSVLPPTRGTTEPPTLLVLPGSRNSEIERLLPIFRDTLVRMRDDGVQFAPVLPALHHLAPAIEDAVGGWPVRPDVVVGETAKWQAFASARAALAASGTVTLELGLAGVPMVVAYRLDPLVASLKWLYRRHSVVMANLMLGENVFPEFIHHGCTPQALASALSPLMADTPARAAQETALRRLREVVTAGAEAPSRHAARLVMEAADICGVAN